MNAIDVGNGGKSGGMIAITGERIAEKNVTIGAKKGTTTDRTAIMASLIIMEGQNTGQIYVRLVLALIWDGQICIRIVLALIWDVIQNLPGLARMESHGSALNHPANANKKSIGEEGRDLPLTV